MPDLRDLLNEGIRQERSGASERAALAYGEVIESADGADDAALVAEARRRLADVHRTVGAFDEAVLEARQSRDVAEAAGLRELAAEALNAEAAVHQTRGDFAAALPLLERILELSRDERVRGIAYQNLGIIAATEGDLQEADRRFRRSEACFRAAGYRRGEVIALTNHARLLLDRGQVDRAEPICAEAVEAARRLDELEMVAVATLNHAEAMLALDRLDEADQMASAAVGYFSSAGNKWRLVEGLRVLGEIHVGRGKSLIGRRCFLRARDMAEELGAQVEARRLTDRIARSGPAE